MQRIQILIGEINNGRALLPGRMQRVKYAVVNLQKFMSMLLLKLTSLLNNIQTKSFLFLYIRDINTNDCWRIIMGQIIIQVYRCSHCNLIYEIHSYGVFFPPCPFCGKGTPYHLCQKTIET